MEGEVATILICDDEPGLRELMRLSLDPRHSFAEAADGSEAIELFDRLRPDLVLLDVMMPGVSGLGVIRHIRSHSELADAPVVVVTAFAGADDTLAALDAGATSFVGKPFDPDELAALVEDLLPSGA